MILSARKIFKKIFKNSGFTLLELIVAFSIIAILSTVGIASYINFARWQTLQQAYLDFFNTVSLARANAASQVKPSQCISSSTLDGYRVRINTVANSYTLSVVCSGIDYIIFTKSLSTGVVFNKSTDNPPTTTTDILFSVLTSGVTNPGNVVLSYPAQASIAPKIITITSVGGIK